MICIVGGGKMGAALVGGLVTHGYDITVVETDEQRRQALADEGRNVSPVPVACEGAIIAVKPKDVAIATADAVGAGAKRILSIAAGIPLRQLHEAAGAHVPILRAMPNIGALVQRSAVAIAAEASIHEEDLTWAEEVLSTVGNVVRVTEDQMDAVTGLSGSGPAYILMMAEAMIEAGVIAGLSHDVATELTITTIEGVGELMATSADAPAEIRAMVTTPGGTTAHGIRKLESMGFRSAVVEAVLSASARSSELGRPSR